eukprot:g14334.t1
MQHATAHDGSSDSESDDNTDGMNLHGAGEGGVDQQTQSQATSIDGEGGASDGEGETSTIGVILHETTRVGDSFQATIVPKLRARTAEAKEEDVKIAPKKDHLLWDASRAPDERRLQQLVKRLHVGSIKEGTRRPTTLLSHTDVVAALHRCKYDPASAEASLIALARRREAKYVVASAASDARNSGRCSMEQAVGGSATAAVKTTGNTSPKVLADAPPGGKVDVGGNRWEDWSENDRVAFLAQLGEKHKDMNDMVKEFPAKSHADIIEFYYNWKFHEPDYSRWQFMKRQIDIALTYPDFHQDICEICEEGGELLLCDTCSLAFHLHCLSPRLEDPPDNDWSCPECLRKHITPESRARAKLFVKQRISSIEEQRRSMAKDEERRHERQAVYGYLGHTNASIEHGNIREGGAGAAGVENGGEKALVDAEAEAQAERELSNRPWGKEDLAQLQRAVDEFGERGWRVIMATDKYKSLFHMRCPPIVRSMHRMLKDNDLKRAKTRARIAARADTKAKAREEASAGSEGEVSKEFKEGMYFAEADAAAAAVTVARTEAYESVDHKDEQAGGTGAVEDKNASREQRALLQKFILEHGVGGLQTKLDLPAYNALKEAGSPSALSNQWRSMHHRLRRRLAREGMAPKRRPGRPPKNPPMQNFPSFGGNKVASPPLQSGSTERGAAAATKAADGKADPQANEESESESGALDEEERGESPYETMGRVLTRFIDDPMVYACANCKTHLSTEGNIESKEFHTANGRGFLIKNVINVTNGPSDERELRTGRHTCEDVYCVTCDTNVGWEYMWAFDKAQKYKVGKFVLDAVKVMRYHWEGDD